MKPPVFASLLSVFCVLLALLFGSPASARGVPCQVSAAISSSTLTVDELGSITAEFSSSSQEDRTVGVLFEVIDGDADFDGEASPLLVPVDLTGASLVPVKVEVKVAARSAGEVRLRVSWLDDVAETAGPLMCGSSVVSPNTFDLQFTAVAAARSLQLDIADGDDQEIQIGEESDPLVVQVESSDGSDTGDLLVEFSLVQAGALALSATTATTDADGQAEITVEGLVAGQAQVQARLLGQENSGVEPVFFDVKVVTESAGANLEIVDGDEQELELDTLSDPLEVAAFDDNDEPLVGEVVEWRVEPPSAAILEHVSTLTDDDGHSDNRVRALRAGEFEVVAQLSGVDPEDESASTVRFSISAGEAGGGEQLKIVEGDEQELDINVPSDPLVVEAFDGDDEPLGAAVVQWRVEPAGAAVLDTASNSTDAEGEASNRVRALRAGEFEVVAQLAGVDPEDLEASTVHFSLSADAAGKLSLVSGNSQNLSVNAQSAPLIVAAADDSGRPLVNSAIDWKVEPAGAATLESGSTLTDSAGKAQNRVRASQAGSFVVVAQLADSAAGGMGTVRFSVNAESLPTGSTLRVISGNDQGLVPGSPSDPLVVELRNSQGQPIVGARLRFSATPDNAGMFDPSEVVTLADGRASSRVIPQLPGGLTVTVTAVGDPTITTSFALRGGTSFIPGLNTNQQGVASAIDAACPQLSAGAPPPAGGAGADFLARCNEIVGAANARPADVQNALNQLLPDEAAPQATASLNIRDSQLRNLDVRLDALRSGARRNSLAGLTLNTQSGALPLALLTQLANGAQDDEDVDVAESEGFITPWGAFLTGTIGRVDRDTTNNNPGFDGNTLSLTGGVDYRFSNRLVGGLALGYDDSSVDLVNDTGSIDTRSLTLSAYGAYSSDNDFYIDGRAALGRLDFDLARNIRYNLGSNPVDVTALASPEGESRLLAMTLGRNFNRNRWNFGGYLRGELSRIDLDGYSETVAQSSQNGRGLVVRIDDRSLESRTATLGLRAGFASSRNWGVLLPFSRLEWVHEFENQPQTTVARFINDPTGTPIIITGDEQDDGYGNVALGLTAVFANGRSAFVQYERRFAQEAFDRQSLTLGGRFEF